MDACKLGYMVRVTLGNLRDLVSAVAKCLYELQEHETHAPVSPRREMLRQSEREREKEGLKPSL